MRSPPWSSISVLRSALLVAGLFVACGRTVLDDPVDVTGTAGGDVGSAGVIGTAGGGGTAGFVGTAGFSGTAGIIVGGTAGFVGGTAGFSGGTAGFVGTAGFSGTAGAGGARVCSEGDTECFGTTDVDICKGGQWIAAFTCPNGCLNGVCEECRPSTTQCATAMTEQLCGPSGIWGAPMPCAGACSNGSCNVVQCIDGDTTCASSETQQTCINGAWGPPTDCEYVCDVNACSENRKFVFVTSKVFEGGGLGGLLGADEMCQVLAQSAGLMGTYFAWLSDATDSPETRFSKNGGPYQLVDGTELAHNWTELTQVGLINGISTTELQTLPGNGTSACGGTAVWTNTKNDGTLNDIRFSCDDWSNPFGMGAALGVAGGNLGWTDECMLTSAMTTTPCEQTAALYCFEQ